MTSSTPKTSAQIRDFTNLTEYEASKAKDGDVYTVEYETARIRAVRHKDEWHFSVVDVIGALTESENPATYWRVLKSRLKAEGADETVTNCNGLKLCAADGKMRVTDCAAPDTLFRIIQSIPSPKAEPFKRWLAEVAYEWLKDKAEPSRAIERAIAEYRAQGYDDDWINLRLQDISSRNALTDQWTARDVPAEKHGLLTWEMSLLALGISPGDHRELKKLPKSEELGDHMEPPELAIKTLSETAGKTLIVARNTKTYRTTRRASLDGAKVAGVAREELERQLGRPVVTKTNFLPKPAPSLPPPKPSRRKRRRKAA